MTTLSPVPSTSPLLDEHTQQALQSEVMLRKAAALESLNVRIARLSIALGLELNSDVDMRTALESNSIHARHQHSFPDELRGLLTLRHQMEIHLAEEVGHKSLLKIVGDVERHMERIGFPHGIDGIHEERMLGVSST